MIDKDQSPLDAVEPTPEQREFLKRIVTETSEYARAKNLNDMIFQGHGDQSYFGAYSTTIVRRGAGRYIFGFARRGGKLHMAIPIDIPEPYRLAKSWIGDPNRNRAMIDMDKAPSEEMQLYFIEMGKRSIDFHYKK